MNKICLGAVIALCGTRLYADNLESRIDSVMSRMTLEDKIGQLNQLDGRKDIPYLESLIRKGQLGSIMNITDPAEVNRLQRIAIEESPSGIPIIFSRDVVHGFRTILPIPLGQAATFNETLVESGARNAAAEAAGRGIKWAFAPMLDISRDPRWGRIAESFGEDTYLTSSMARAVVSGYQTEDMSAENAVAACAKHFVGYGAAEGGRDYNTTGLTERQLRDIYLPPFRKAVDNRCASVMSSFNDNDGLPTSANGFLLDSILRKEWKFDGVVVSDWGAIGELVPFGVAEDRREAAKIALIAGTDMDMSSKSYVSNLSNLVRTGEISISDIDKAVRRILRLKFRTGLFDRPYCETSPTDWDMHYETAEKLAEESAVLLKNDNRTLPFGKSVRNILVTGPLAHSPHDQLGTWNMDGDTSETVTPKEAFLDMKKKGYRITYIPGLDYCRDTDTSSFPKLRRAAEQADIIVAFVGEEAIMSGEAHSLADISLKGMQTEMLRVLSESGKPLVSVFMAGRPMTIRDEIGMSDAAIYFWHPGTAGGTAIARLLTGEATPSGKLPVTFPSHVGQIPIYYNCRRLGRPARNIVRLQDIPRNAGQSVLGHSSYYLDEGDRPLFEFGYGLSYTEFELSEIRLSDTQFTVRDTISVYLNIRNIGEYPGDEVVQVYISDDKASVTRPVKELKAFRKIHLEPYEKKSVRILIPVNELSFTSVSGTYIVEPGSFTIRVGTSSDSGKSLKFNVIKEADE